MQNSYLGLMSGTSMDAIDVALVDFTTPRPVLSASHSLPIPSQLKSELLMLCSQQSVAFKTLAKLDVEMGHLFADAALALLQSNNIASQSICAIGSHGQTVFHQPGGTSPTSYQIGDPNIIAERTGITTVADFRRRDMAAGGQGAPLVPAFHRQMFQSELEERVVLNIGGIANITRLPSESDKLVSGFDTGPGNLLMDAWCQRHLNTQLDEGGVWAGKGTVIKQLLDQLMLDSYFNRQPPKSTGREYFNIAWVDQAIGQLGLSPKAEDVQATLCELSALSIAQAIKTYTPNAKRVLVCGGGVHNDLLMRRLQYHLMPRGVASTMIDGIDPNWVEAMAFAWLARQTMQGLPGNLPSVTGAGHETVLGGIYNGKPSTGP